MERNFRVLKFLSQVFIIYGATTLLLNILCILFGDMSMELSGIFSLGSKGISVAASLQFLLAVTAVTALRVVFMTDILIKRLPTAARIVMLFASAFAVTVAFILLFDWFPADMPLAWVMFVVCFAVSCAVSTLISVMYERNENRRLDQALKRCKEEK